MVINLNRIYIGILILFFVLLFYFSKLDLIFFFFIFFLSILEIFKNKILNTKLSFIFLIIGSSLLYSTFFFNIDKLLIFAYLISFFLVFLKDSLKNFFFALVIYLFFINLFLVLHDNRDLFYFIIFISFFNDTIAYFFGNLLAGPKITPIISPNKTWSGTISSFILSSIFIYFYVNNSIFICLLMSISLFFGDLFFSIIKRNLKIKDFSNLLKSHGGLLDRLDSMIFLPLIININIII